VADQQENGNNRIIRRARFVKHDQADKCGQYVYTNPQCLQQRARQYPSQKLQFSQSYGIDQVFLQRKGGSPKQPAQSQAQGNDPHQPADGPQQITCTLAARQPGHGIAPLAVVPALAA